MIIYCNLSESTQGCRGAMIPAKNYLRASGFAELPPGPAKLVAQPQ